MSDDEIIDVEELLSARESARKPRTSARKPAKSRGGKGRTPRKRRLVTVAVAAAGLLAGLGLWGYLAYGEVSAVRDDLFAARDDLDAAREALFEGSMSTARAAFDDAASTFGGVEQRLAGATVLPARIVPRYDRTLDAVATLSTSAAVIAESGVEVTSLLTGDEGGLGALTPTEGRVPVDALVELHAELIEVAATLAAARADVESVPTSGVEEQVIEARSEFLDVIEQADELLPTATDILSIIPPLLGSEGERTYVVIASNPTEARGTGGYFGAYTVAEVEDGELRFTDTGELYDLPAAARGSLSFSDPSLGARYNRYGGASYLPNINMTPDFPSAAEAVEQYMAEVVGVQVDGVLAIDPYGFEALLQIAGPVEVQGYGAVGADEVVQFVSRDAYAVITDSEERKRLIGEVAIVTLQRFLRSPGDADLSSITAALSDVVRRESLLIHSADDAEQAIIADLGLAGPIGGGAEDGGDLLSVVLNSGAPYKIDYFLRRTLDYEVSLAADGSSRGTVLAGFENTVPPEGEVDYMVGFGEEPLAVGDALSYVSTYCSPGCAFEDVPPPGFQELPTDTGLELGFGVSSSWLLTPGGQSRQLSWSYVTPSAWTRDGDDRVYRLTYDHQTTIIPILVSVTVNIPDGFDVLQMPADATVEDGQVQISFMADADRTIELILTPTG